MLTHERLLEVLRYEPSEGRFYWRKFGKGIKRSKKGQAGSYDVHGYGQIVIDSHVYKEHRLVWFYVYGEWPDGQIDHINHDRRDNRVENLRVVDNQINHKNRPKQKNNKTGTVGVWAMPNGRFQAYINVNGKRVSLGKHKTLDEAKAAREKANQEYGFHKNHGDGFGVSKVVKMEAVYKSNARLIEIDGEQKISTEWAKHPLCTVSASIIRSRMMQGWNAKDAVFTPFVTCKQRQAKRIRNADGTYAKKETPTT